MSLTQLKTPRALLVGTPEGRIDGDGLHVPKAWDGVLEVLFDGHRVWSVTGSRHPVSGGGLRVIPWPGALRPYLDGFTRVTLREYATGRVLLDREHRFGAGSGPVRVVDTAGYPMAVDSGGRLHRPFDVGSPEMADSLLEQVSRVLAVLRDDCGLPAFINFGALLGAVREGELIGHDCDADVSYLSPYEHPLDVARESFRVERVFRDHGFRCLRFSAADFKVMVTDADRATRGIDVFTAFSVEDYLYVMPRVRARLPRSLVLPLTEVTLHGRRLPAPADPEAWLEAMYGPGWRVPDPSWREPPSPAARRRIDGWMRGIRPDLREYWSKFYRDKRSAGVPSEPSAFARWVAEREGSPTAMVDIGSGNGRDALWFARCGHRVLGIDFAGSAVARARRRAKSESSTAGFEKLDLYELRQALTMGARLASWEQPRCLYGRFLLHALRDEGRQNLWRLSEMALRAGGRLYLEFRTDEDAGSGHAFGQHFRRFLEPDRVVGEIEARGGHVEHREEGRGLAPYGDEDPHICRLVVGWQR